MKDLDDMTADELREALAGLTAQRNKLNESLREIEKKLMDVLSPFKHGDRIKHKETGEVLVFDYVKSLWSTDRVFSFNAYRIKKNGELYAESYAFFYPEKYELVQEENDD